MNKSKTTWGTILAYGLGGVLINMTIMGNEYGFFFLSDIAKVDAGAVGIILSITGILGAIMDPVVGNWADGTNTRFGKYRPFLIFGGLATAILLILEFTVPPFKGTPLVLYYGFIMIAFQITFAATVVPWQGMMSVLSTDYNARNRLLTSRTVIGGLVGSLLGILLNPGVAALGGGAAGWQRFAMCGMAIGLVCMFICQNSMKEIDKPGALQGSGEKKPLFSALFGMMKSKPVMCLALAMLINSIFITVGSQVSMHYYEHILHDSTVLMKTSGWTLPVTVGCSLVMPFILRKIDKRLLVAIGTVLHMIKPVVIMIGGLSVTPDMVVWLTVLQRAGSSFYGGALYALIPDCVDYNRWKTGVGAAALVSATATFAQKLGRSLGSAVAGGLLSISGYTAGEVITDASVTAILNMNGIYQVIGFALTFIPILVFPITRKKGDQIRAELSERDAAEEKAGETETTDEPA